MDNDDIAAYCYQVGMQGSSEILVDSQILQEINEILFCKDNFTYTELQALEAETVELIFIVVNNFERGQNFKNSNSNNTKEIIPD